MVLAPVLVAILEKSVFRPFCTGCDRRVSRDARECGFCGGIIAGDIRHRRERYAAEEKFWDERGGQPPHFTRDSDVDAEKHTQPPIHR